MPNLLGLYSISQAEDDRREGSLSRDRVSRGFELGDTEIWRFVSAIARSKEAHTSSIGPRGDVTQTIPLYLKSSSRTSSREACADALDDGCCVQGIGEVALVGEAV